MINPQVAFSKDFLESYSKLPRKVQKKVRDFTEKFQRDPTQPGLNFERITEARDDKARSVRIDQSYRAIIVHPPKGDVYLCVWVDNHDEAYSWVRNRVFEINPLSGTFQIFEAVEGSSPELEALAPEPELESPEAADESKLFAAHDDEDLLLAGVPEILLGSVRALVTEEDLDSIAPHLPADATEMLYFLAAGYGLLEAIEESERTQATPGTVDTEDFQGAMTHPVSQQSIKVVDDESELEDMLAAPLSQWRVFLHPSQRKQVVINANGPVRVLGGAGTGKTVVLMHRAKHLTERVFPEPTDRVLVTTYTRNLSIDLKVNIRNLCTSEAAARIEVVNLHSWTADFMRRQGHSFKIINDKDREAAMDSAISEVSDGAFPLSFCLDEWDQIVQGQEVSFRDDYFTARRVGRGRRLARKQRAAVWEVFERYREILDSDGYREWPDVVRETRLFIENNSVSIPYKAVLADEVQDLTYSDLKLLRTLAPDSANSLFLVGDGHPVTGLPLGI